MIFNPRAVALQGIGFATLLVAVQGLAPATVTVPEPHRYYSMGTDAVQALRRQQLEEDEVILAVIQQFVLET
ncbi:MAG: hypothetical protein CGW95_15035 [Phenylobacterium zucineum]|nr:MAG: hypothetical protein CGW95_15035 [Phenylobacterium zucineum]